MWTESLMHMHPIDVIYLNYAKAFDIVHQQRLLPQIYSFRIMSLMSSEHFLHADDREFG